MSFRLLSIAAVATLLAAAPAFAQNAPTSSYDDVTYPANPASFGAALDDEAIVTADVTYPGPHTVFTKTLPSRSDVLAYDDVVYPVADELVPAPPVPVPDERLACECALR